MQFSTRSEFFRTLLNGIGSVCKILIHDKCHERHLEYHSITHFHYLTYFQALNRYRVHCFPPIKTTYKKFIQCRSLSLFPPSTRLNYFRIFLYFSVGRPNLSGYLCSQQVCSAIPRPRARNSPSRRRYLASTCFPTTIYDVMKRIRSTSESFLPSSQRPRSLASHRRLPAPPCSYSRTYLTLWPITPSILLPLPFIPSSFFSYRLP